uniref:Uncharacterized protein n=1 Tax=Paracoccus marcusii TaxID=59779 RepID=J7K1Q5_9RHOB|nr:hypothetical protein [Paracoccus marcusii]AFQ90348.1 hypothetical protein [Paracoccus marcusii]
MTNKKDTGVTRLEDEMVEDVFAMSDAEIEAELREESVDIDAFDKEMDDLFASALAEGGQRRLQDARKAVDLHHERQKRKEQQKSQDELRAQIAAIVAGNPDLTMAARNFEQEHDGDLLGVLEDLQELTGDDWDDDE